MTSVISFPLSWHKICKNSLRSFTTDFLLHRISVRMASDDESSRKFLDKMKANPSVPIGLLGLLGIVSYGLYNFKNKKQNPSIYLIQMRVAAQGTLISCMTLGLVYTLGKNHIHKLFPDKKN